MNEAVKTSAQSLGGNCVGILDIYGFEVFEKNGWVNICFLFLFFYYCKYYCS